MRAPGWEYWLVDGEAPGVEVLKLADARYEPHGYFEQADTLTSSLLTGFALPVRQAFE